jgi:hypothetical protein
LINVELKIKSLFLRRNLYAKEENIIVTKRDFLYNERNAIETTRNINEWFNDAENMIQRNLITTKQIYWHFIDQQNFVPRIETAYPTVDFRRIWYNISRNHIPTDWKIATYLIISDVVPNAARLSAHRISQASPLCVNCNFLDNNVHRIKLCCGSSQVWMWLTNLLQNRFRMNVSDPEELL